MIDEPIKMVVVSSASALLLFLFIIFYKKFFNKNISLLLLLLLISLLPLVSMLRSGTYESGDLSIHSSFAIAFYESLREGIFFPVWDKYMLGGYGYPYFLFTYPLPYYLVSLLHSLGFTFINAFKLLAAFSYILSGFAMYFLVKEETKEKISGFIAAVFYLFAPYHLLDLHFRFAIGEVLSFLFLPLSFYFLKKVKLKESYKFFLFLSLSVVALIISHQAISLIASLFLLLYAFYIYLSDKDFRSFFIRVSGVFTGIMLASFYWIPVIVESGYTYLLDRQTYFYPFIYYIFSPSRYGLLYQGNYGELYFPIGYIHLPILIITFFILLVPALRAKFFKKESVLLFVLLISFFITFFMMLAVSEPVWKSLPLINGFLFTYRFSMFCAFFSSIVAGIVLAKIKKTNVVYTILAITILITILNWGNRKVIPQINDEVLRQGLYKKSQPVGLGATIWSNVDKLQKRESDIELLSGEAEISEISRSSINHQYLIDVNSSNAKFVENTIYFPGWKIKINNKEEMINENKLNDGLITFNLNKGLYYVVVELGLTIYQITGRLISLIFLVVLFIPLASLLRRKTN